MYEVTYDATKTINDAVLRYSAENINLTLIRISLKDNVYNNIFAHSNDSNIVLTKNNPTTRISINGVVPPATRGNIATFVPCAMITLKGQTFTMEEPPGWGGLTISQAHDVELIKDSQTCDENALSMSVVLLSEVECRKNNSCKGDEICKNFKCEKLECEGCQYSENQTCKSYPCCEDSGCSNTQKCQNHRCVEQATELKATAQDNTMLYVVVAVMACALVGVVLYFTKLRK